MQGRAAAVIALKDQGLRPKGAYFKGAILWDLRRCRDEWLAPPAERDVVRFPYTVLELKLSNSICPLWVTELIAAGVPLSV